MEKPFPDGRAKSPLINPMSTREGEGVGFRLDMVNDNCSRVVKGVRITVVRTNLGGSRVDLFPLVEE